jgi:hypothetical protein
MPSMSEAQWRLMQAAAHSPEVAKSSGVPQKVAREYVKADQALGQKAASGYGYGKRKK